MTWPLSQDYNEAIQSPLTSLADPELRSGEPTTNTLGMPQPRSGNFADVYEFVCPQGRWAVKCFTREVPGLRERYAEISRHLASVQLPFAVEFHYLEQGVRIRGAWYSALKMRWVEGQLLNEFVRDNLTKPARLQALSQIWTRMAKRLREAGLAHADLQHGNVILVPGSSANSLAVKLIDYDGMFVPALAGRGSAEVGHANYQHPARLREGTYGPEVDRFPLLVVATALRALTVGGQELWDRYDNGDNLLFKESDFRDPAKSQLFAELLRSADPDTSALAKQLQRAVSLPLEDCPLLDEPEPSKPAASPLRSTATRPGSPRSTPVAPLASESSKKAKSKRDSERKTAPSRVPLIAGLAGVSVAVLALLIGVVWAMRPAKEKEVVKLPVAKIEQKGEKKASDKGPDNAPRVKLPVEPSVPVVVLPSKIGEIRRFDGGPAVAFSLDGGTVAYANTSHNVALWDLVRNTEVGQLAGHEKTVNAIRFSPDGKQLLSASDDGTVRLWDVKTAQELKGLPGHINGAKALAWLPDGRSFVSYSGDREVVVWNAVTGVAVRRARIPIINHNVAFSPSGALLLLGGDDFADHLWDVAQDREMTVFDKHSGSHSYALAFSADERRGMVAGTDHILRVLDLKGGKNLDKFPLNPTHCYALAVSRDGKRLLSGGLDTTVQLWDLATGSAFGTLKGHTKSVKAVAVSPNGRFAASSGADNTVRLWGLPVPGEKIPETEPVVPADGERLYEGHASQVDAVAFSPDGKSIVSGGQDKVVRLWDRTTGKTIRTLEGHTADVSGAVFSPDGKRVATCAFDKTVRLWDAETGKQTALFAGHTGVVKTVEFSPDGRRLLSAGDDNTMRLWDVASSSQLRRFDLPPGHWAHRAAFSPDGRYAVCSSSDGNVRVYSLQTGKLYRTLAGAGDAYSCGFEPDMLRVVSCSFDGYVRVWDVAGGKLLHQLAGHQGKVGGVALSPDNRHALTSGHDKTVRLWDLKQGREVRQFPYFSYHSLAFSPDARFGLCGGVDGIVRVWPLKLDDTTPITPAKPREPDAEARQTAEDTIKERYKTEFASRGVVAHQGLAKKLVEDAETHRDDPAVRFVCLSEARNLAGQVGDFSLSLRILDDMNFLFASDEIDGRMALLNAAIKGGLVDRLAVATLADSVVQDALAADRYETAAAALAIARKVTTSAANKLRLTRLDSQLASYRKEFDTIKGSVEKLARQPGDAEASLALGKFRCFRKGDWAGGLPLLAAGNDADLAALAKKDLIASPEAADQMEVGNGWWDVAQKEPVGQPRNTILRHARATLYLALPRLKALDVSKVADRLKFVSGKTVLKPGLVMQIYADEELKKLAKTQMDYQVATNWGLGSPAPEVPADHFSVRWQGWLIPPRKDKYTLYIHIDDGAQLYLDSKLVKDAWRNPGRHIFEVTLSDRPYRLLVKFREGDRHAMMVFGYVDGSTDRAIPAEWLFHDEKQEKFLAN